MLIGKLCVLRPLERADLPLLVAWRNAPHARLYFIDSTPLSLAGQERWFEQYLARSDEQRFIIECGDPPVAIGTIGLISIDHRHQSAEGATLVIGEKAYRTGRHALDVCITLGKYVFHDLGLNRMTAEVLAENRHMLLLSKHLGMQQEGIKRQAVFRGGRFQDVILLSLLRSEFEERYGA